MSGMSFDFLNQTIPLAAATTTVVEHETTLQNEIFLLTGALCNLVNSANGGDAASLIESWNEFITLAYQSLPVVDDARSVLLSFFAFEREFKALMNPDDLRWGATAMQLRRIKDGIVLMEMIGDEVAV